MARNIIANFFGRFWSIFAVFIFIPLYIRFLGIELYGLVSFFATMQSILFLLDAGLSATLRREFSKGSQQKGDYLNKYKLLRSIEFCYYVIIAFIIVLTYFGAGFIVSKWLNLGNIDRGIAVTAIRLMGISISLQFLSSLYFGSLLGLEKQVVANVLQIGWSMFKNLFVVMILWLVAPDIRLFYAWFILSDILYLFLSRKIVLRTLKVDSTFNWACSELKNLKQIWRYATGIIIISVLSALCLQLDKLIISKTLPISDLGIYNMAFSLSQIPVILVNAAAIAIFTRLVFYYSTNELEKQKALFAISYRILAIISISVSLTMGLYTREIIQLWTGNSAIAEQGWLPAMILTFGSLLMSLQVIPLNLVFSHGVTRINTMLGIFQLMIMTPLMLVLINWEGIVGASFSWLITLLLIMPVYICYIYYKLVSKNWLRWFISGTVYPIALIGLVVLIFFSFGKMFHFSSVIKIIYALISGLITLIISFVLLVKNIKTQFYTIRSQLLDLRIQK